MSTTSTGGGAHPPDSFQGTRFTFGLTITDNATNASGTLTFDGVLNGQLSATSSNATGTFSLDPGSPSSLTLSGRNYQVTVTPTLALPAPGGQALLNANVIVGAQPSGGGGGGPPVQSVPEPSAFALAGIALAALGLARRRRRQRGSPQAA